MERRDYGEANWSCAEFWWELTKAVHDIVENRYQYQIRSSANAATASPYPPIDSVSRLFLYITLEELN